MSNFRHLQHMRSSFATGRPGLRESRKIDFDKLAYGSVQVGDGRYYWVVFEHLSDWRDGGDPLDSGYRTNEMKAHSVARAAVRHLLNEREQLPPMPESFVAAYHQRLMDRAPMQEQVARWMALLERDDGTIAGYDWQEVCEANDFDLIDPSLDPEEDDTEAQDMDVDEAA